MKRQRRTHSAEYKARIALEALKGIKTINLWRSLKCEDIYQKDYRNLLELETGLERWMRAYNHRRIHQTLDYRRPWDAGEWMRPLQSSWFALAATGVDT